MKLSMLHRIGVAPALELLPEKMDSPMARHMILAISHQESRATYRRQIGGPARGYQQFEKGGGVRGVLNHHSTKDYAISLCAALDYSATDEAVYTAIEHNDVLAAGFSRLLLWTLPQALPEDEHEGWEQYIAAWRPGKPHPDTWPTAWKLAEEALLVE